MFREFKEFILKGNMLDLAVGVIIGAAFGDVVTKFTDLLLSAITFFTGTTEVGEVPLLKKSLEGGGKLVVDAGPIINAFISLLIVGFALFLVVKVYNAAKKSFEKETAEEEAEAKAADVLVLEEIRDLLKAQN